MNILQMLCEEENPVASSNMKPTVAWMSAKFDELNSRFFGGQLPKPMMVVTELGYKTLGSFGFEKKISINSRTRMPIVMGATTTECDLVDFGPMIKMNSEVSRSESRLANTLCHEMVHWYCDWTGCMRGWGFPKQSHGSDFKRKAESINVQSNGEFSISTYADLGSENAVLDDRLMSQKQRREQAAHNAPCHVLWLKYKNGKEGFIVCYPASSYRIAQEIIEANRALHHIEWLRELDDTMWGNIIKNEANVRISRSYNGYYDVDKFPLAKDTIHKNSHRFEEWMLTESCLEVPKRHPRFPITEDDCGPIDIPAGAPIHED